MDENIQKKPNTTKYVIFAVLFLLFYFILYALTLFGKGFEGIPVLNVFFPISEWTSPTYWLLPLAGFFAVYFLISYIKKEFETSFSERVFFPIFFFFISMLAFYLNLFFFYMSSVPGKRLFICLMDCQNTIQQLKVSGIQNVFLIEFFPQLKTSAFFAFVLAGLFAWLTYYLMKQLKAKGMF